MKGKCKKIVLLVVLCSFSTLVFSGKASAVANSSDIMKKWIFTQYYACVRSMNDSKPNMEKVVERKDSGTVVKSVFSGGSLALPSYNFGHSFGDKKLSCEEDFVGKSLLGKKVTGASEYGGGFGGAGSVKWDNLSSSQDFLERLGYTLEITGDGEKMFTIGAQKSSVTNASGTRFGVDWGNTSTLVIVAKKNRQGKYTYSVDGWGNLWSDDFDIRLTKDKFEIKLKATVGLAGNACTPSSTNEEIIVKLDEDDVDAFLEDLNSKLSGVIWQRTCSNYSIITNESYRFNADSVDSGDVGNFVYAKDKNSYDVSNDVIKTMSGMNLAGLRLTNSELYVLYTHYINFFLPDDGANRISCDSDASGVEVKLKDVDGEFKQCHINTSGLDLSVTVYTQAFDGRLRQPYPWITTITIQGIIDWLKTVDTNTLTDVPTPTSLNPGHVSDDKKKGDANSQVCYNGSGPIGWLVCPVIKMVSGIGNSLWGTIEKSFMIIPARQIFNENAGVRTAWDVIRNIGNIFFVVLFMIVIFSQLTGVGIDNYGIKKILPKLILVAVLANLSWIICELVVDVSNIIGSSITGLLTNVASSIATPSGSGTASMVVAGVGDVALAGGGAALFVLLNGWNLAGLAALGLAVLGVAISIVSGIIVMYIILIIRQAGVILLIALSPIAIVCYALPNTEKLFKKWRDLFKALLVVYPLCGAALGAGKLASAVLASIAGGDSSGLITTATAAISAGDIGKLTTAVFAADNNGSTGLMLAAMIVQVLPFFFIPKLLKNSLALMGNIGEKISRTGRSLGRKTSNLVQGGVKNSDRFKSFQKFETEKMKNRRAIRRRDRNDSRIEDGLSGADRAEFRALRNKIRSGESLSDSEMKKYNELKEKSTYKPSDWQNRLTGEANTTIMGFQQSLDKDKQNTDDLYVAGQMKSSEHAIQEATDKAYDWNEQLLVDEFNNTWVSNGKGKYVTVDKNGKRHTAAAATLESMPGVRKVSRSEAMQNKEYVDRRRQIGQFAGWTNKDTATEAAVGAQLSSIESSRSDVQQTRLSGDKNVLQLQHDENTSKMNELEGRAQANAEFRVQGLDTTTSVETSRQAAEERLTNVVAQNNAAKDFATKVASGGYTDKYGNVQDRTDIIGKAIEAGTNKQINRRTNTVASDNAGEVVVDYDVAMRSAQNKYNLENANNDINVTPEISAQYAQSLAKQRFDTSQEKMFSEQLANNDRAKSISDLAGAIYGTATVNGIEGSSDGNSHLHDANYIRAAIKDVVAKGGVEDLNNLIKNSSREIHSDPTVSRVIGDYMATMSVEPEMKAYGKYRIKMRDAGFDESDIPTYDMWIKAPDFGKDSDPDGIYSLDGFIRANGNTVLSNASKDTFKFYDGDPVLRAKFGLSKVLNGSLGAKDNETRIAANKMLKNSIEDLKASRAPADFRNEISRVIDGASTSQWANMESSTFDVLMGAYLQKELDGSFDFGKLPPQIQQSFRDVKARLDKSGGTVKANMRQEIRDFFDKKVKP